MYTLQGSPPPSSTHLLQSIDLCNDLDRPPVDATMTPDSASALHESINKSPTPRPRCTTLPRPSVVDEVEEHRIHRTTTPRHHVFQNDAPKREERHQCAAIVRSGITRSRVSPGTSGRGGGWMNRSDDAFIKVPTPTGAAVIGPDRVRARLSPAIIENPERPRGDAGLRMPPTVSIATRAPSPDWIPPRTAQRAEPPEGSMSSTTPICARRIGDPRRSSRRRFLDVAMAPRGCATPEIHGPTRAGAIFKRGRRNPPRRRQRPGFAWPRPRWQRGGGGRRGGGGLGGGGARVPPCRRAGARGGAVQ
jgi:hypothetical protein